MVSEVHTKWFITGEFRYPSGLMKEETKHFWSKTQDPEVARERYESRLGDAVTIHSVEREDD